MCGDYRFINKWIWFDKYAMPKEIFAIAPQAKVFNILDLWFRYHHLPFCESDKVNIAFWGID
jgi:hypothetical protein